MINLLRIPRLRFEGPLEQTFQEDYRQNMLPVMRLTGMLGIGIVLAFAILDYWAIPSIFWNALLIRVIAAVLLASLIPISLSSQIQQHVELAASLAVIFIGVGIAIMIALANPVEIGYSQYYVGTMLVTMGGYVFFPLRFRYAVTCGLAILAAYDFAAIVYQHLLTTSEGILIFATTNFFLIFLQIIGGIGNYSIEYYRRHDFMQRRTLGQQNADLEAYSRTVAHDLKNPLGAIVGYAEMLTTDFSGQLPTEAEETAHDILRTGRNSVNIINAMLLLANARREGEVKVMPMKMEGIVDNALLRLVSLTEESGAQIKKPDTWPAAVGFAPWVEEVWANYISNAIKYGGTPPIVELGATVIDNTVRFWVKDNGAGISPEAQATLFREFSRLDVHTAKEGHGLGLSIVQRIVEKMKGKAGLSSQVGQGSTFYFELPAVTAW